MDVRLAQTTLQAIFLFIGIVFLGFPIGLKEIAIVVSANLFFQWLWDHKTARAFNWKSALPSAMSLLLLLRVIEDWVWLVACAVCISSKFLLRYKQSHFFNPSGFVLFCFLLLGQNYAWVSSGQWGQVGLLCFVLSTLGFYMVYRVPTLNISLSFILSYIALLAIRFWYLGDPLLLLLHPLQNAGLWLFTFFMISDPRTSPINKKSQWIFGIAIAILSYALGVHLHIRNSFFYALIVVSIFTPILKIFFPGDFKWHILSSLKVQNS